MRTRTAILAFLASASCAFAAESTAELDPISHRMMMLVLQLGVILLAARLGNMLMERIGMPGVLGELLAGMIVGPYLLGAVALPALPHGLFPLGDFPVSPELYGVCSLAAVILLFMVGLETDIGLLMRYSVAGTLVGVGGVVVSFVMGDLTAMLFSKVLTTDGARKSTKLRYCNPFRIGDLYVVNSATTIKADLGRDRG